MSEIVFQLIMLDNGSDTASLKKSQSFVSGDKRPQFRYNSALRGLDFEFSILIFLLKSLRSQILE
jgi:hypothetical protein